MLDDDLKAMIREIERKYKLDVYVCIDAKSDCLLIEMRRGSKTLSGRVSRGRLDTSSVSYSTFLQNYLEEMAMASTIQIVEDNATISAPIERSAEQTTSENISHSSTFSDAFRIMRYCCKYGHTSYDENRIGNWTCHHSDNKPNGDSWGDCDISLCPILKGGR